jgi:hypothetical protein
VYAIQKKEKTSGYGLVASLKIPTCGILEYCNTIGFDVLVIMHVSKPFYSYLYIYIDTVHEVTKISVCGGALFQKKDACIIL